MPFIDNHEQTMLQALENALETSDRIDICVGYFYFSGFQLLADSLKDKKIRVLVGKEIDPSCIPEIVQYSREQNVTLEKFELRRPSSSLLQMRQNYVESLVGFVNDSDTFDSPVSAAGFEMFIAKLLDGSLEIRKTIRDYHGKFYLVWNRSELSHRGDFPGTVFHGSSNFTYRGLAGQDELNDVSKDRSKFDEAREIFDNLWTTSESISLVDAASAKEFVSEIREKLWIYQSPSPYELYIRVLSEIYGSPESLDEVKSPSEITGGLFDDFEYQKDAVRWGLDRIRSLDGVIIADVVGLGKSIIAASIAYNLDLDTLIIAPPHLLEQWEQYKVDFRVRGPRVMSSGNMKAVYERYSESRKPLLIVIDEAHRFRNEDTTDYQLLHQICRSNPENKVVLLTATPFNNSPRDVFALIKLFQSPGQSTIKNIDNLSVRFRELIRRYSLLRRNIRSLSEDELEQETQEIASEQRKYLEPVVIRRTRLDLQHVTRYRKDLERQGITFPEVIGPELVEYDLGLSEHLYLDTLERIANPQSPGGFQAARYKPATYIVEKEKFAKAFGSELEGLDLTSAQTNIADLMRKLLVMRFESSRDAFRKSLERMISTNELILRWWTDVAVVPIMKKGQLPDPSHYSMNDDDLSDEFDERLQLLRERRGLLEVPREWVDEKFEDDVKADTQLLKDIYASWFPASLPDPKIERLHSLIDELLVENPMRKIVIFSSYADTVSYVASSLISRGVEGVLRYTSEDSSRASRDVLLSNFDASFKERGQKNDFSILVCTDALSEGVNLNRAGVLINFDIPYNPTRVIQRVGRINRINRKMYPNIRIYNCFPTVIGEMETRLRSISTLKMCLINNIVGSDSRTLTPDEDVKSFFRDEYRKAERPEEALTWDAFHLERYESAKNSPEMIGTIGRIPRRTRIARTKDDAVEPEVVLFSKKGPGHVFVQAKMSQPAQILSIQEGLARFSAEDSENGAEPTTLFPELFQEAYGKLSQKHPLPEIHGRRSEALTVLEALRSSLPRADAYCTDLIRVISKYDDLSEGSLREIAQSDLSDLETCFTKLLRLVPESFVKNIHERVQRSENESELILLAEEFRA